METACGPSEVRKLDGQRPHSQILQGIGELPKALLIGPKSLPDGQDVIVNPKQVSAFGRRRRSYRRESRDTESLEQCAHAGLFAPAEWFPHAEEHSALIGDDRRIVHEYCIRSARLPRIQVPNLGPRFANEGDERVVFRLSQLQIRGCRVSPSAGIRHRKRSVRSSDEHDPEPPRHALAPVCHHREIPGQEIPPASY